MDVGTADGVAEVQQMLAPGQPRQHIVLWCSRRRKWMSLRSWHPSCLHMLHRVPDSQAHQRKGVMHPDAAFVFHWIAQCITMLSKENNSPRLLSNLGSCATAC